QRYGELPHDTASPYPERESARYCPSALPFEYTAGNQHGYLRAIGLILLGVRPRQIAFLQRDAHQDVASRRGGEDQMAERHARRRPEGDQEPQHDRMTHDPVERALREAGR